MPAAWRSASTSTAKPDATLAQVREDTREIGCALLRAWKSGAARSHGTGWRHPVSAALSG
jgi:hypothetical protein